MYLNVSHRLKQRCDEEGTWECWDGPAVNGMSLCL